MLRTTMRLSLCAALALCANAHADFLYSGSLSSSDGLVGAEQWSAGTTLSWTVMPQLGGGWLYEYSLTVPAKAISHFVLETSASFVPSDARGFTWSDDGVVWHDYALTADDVKLQQVSQGNNDMPSDLYGIKFNALTSSYRLDWKFSSAFAPVWGDFYARSGKNGGQDVYVYNAGFPAADPTAGPSNGSLAGHLLVPDTLASPEPATAILLVAGELSLLLRRRSLLVNF